jgi:hypothetical protein
MVVGNFMWASFINKMNALGIPVPTIRDPKSGIGSVSLTLVFISSIMVIVGCVGKWSGKLGVIDINNALEFFYCCSALYFGRNWKTSIPTSTQKDKDER